MTSWKRWLGYAKATLDDTVADGNAELDRLEAEQRAEAADKPWLRPEGDTPSVDDVKAKIEHQARAAAGPAAGPADPAGAATPAPAAPADPTAIDFAAQEREAKARLAGIRKELGLDGPPSEPGGKGEPEEPADPDSPSTPDGPGEGGPPAGR